MQYWHNLVTEESFKVLRKLRQSYDFILIGGWAVYLYAKTLKSKDVDLILDFENLSRFKEDFEIFKNERLRKYEAKIEGVDVDIYVPFYSNPGLPAEEIGSLTQSVEGFTVPRPEILLILKQKTLESRKGSVKGEKDKLDTFSLLSRVELDWKFYKEVLQKFHLQGLASQLRNLLQKTTEVPELALTRPKLKRLKRKLLDALDPVKS